MQLVHTFEVWTEVCFGKEDPSQQKRPILIHSTTSYESSSWSLRAFLLHLSKRFRHVFDLIPNIKAYVDRGALLSRHRYTIAGPTSI